MHVMFCMFVLFVYVLLIFGLQVMMVGSRGLMAGPCCWTTGHDGGVTGLMAGPCWSQ